MLLSFVVGLFWFVVLVTLISTGLGLAITLVGLPLLAGTMYVWIYGAKFERSRIGALLGESIADPYAPPTTDGKWERFRSRLLHRHTWFDLLYLLVLFPVGVAEFVIATVVVTVPFSLLLVPSYYWIGAGPQIPGWQIDTLAEAALLSLVGLPLTILIPYVFVGIGRGHAWFARQLLGKNREAELEARVDRLSDSRSRAVDVSVAELRRIERDLHDGAQPRLVKLSMDLGMAKEKFDSDPEAARNLVESAHEEAKRAMTEIRNLARGIHPAVLTDRGLNDAISALAGQTPVDVEVESRLDQRLPAAVESTAYFIVAEALTNIARHSNANHARIAMRLDGDTLIIDINDDGIGGADPSRGTGLAGMSDRAAALDGSVTITSPAGGPTNIHVELPCA